MPNRLALVLVAAAWMVPGSAMAQGRVPSAPLQSGLITASLPPPRVDMQRSGPQTDLFRAGPDTYAPRVDRQVATPHVWFGPQVGTFGVVLVTPSVSSRKGHRHAPRRARPVQPRFEGGDWQASPKRAVTPAVPKTFYVIPRCYAGDTPPDPAKLRAGCDIGALLTIPPVDGSV